MKGSDFVAARNLYTRDGLVAAVGERCDRVPVESLSSLLSSGKIKPIQADAPQAKKAKA